MAACTGMDRLIMLSSVKKKKDIVLSKSINKDNIVIIDFFNVYCNIIKFNKYKIFSREAFVICLDIVLKKLKDYTVIIISKDIFEVENEYIKSVTKIHTNMKYIIVDDLFLPKSNNRERDDFVCILLHNFFAKNKSSESIILTNDKYKNIKTLIRDAKPFKLLFYENGKEYTNDVDVNLLQRYKTDLTEECLINTVEFKIV